VAVEALPLLEAEAKKRQGTRNDLKPNISTQMSESKESREYAAELAGKVAVSYVSAAKKLAKDDPETFKAVKAGKKTLTQAKRDIKEKKREAKRQQNREKIAARDFVVWQLATTCPCC